MNFTTNNWLHRFLTFYSTDETNRLVKRQPASGIYNAITYIISTTLININKMHTLHSENSTLLGNAPSSLAKQSIMQWLQK